MAKAPPERKEKKASPSTPAALRSAIDRADRELLKLLNLRGRYTAKLAKDTAVSRAAAIGAAGASAATGAAVAPLDDFAPQLEALVAQNKGPLSATCIRAVFRELLSGASALYHCPRVAYLGPAYSFSHVATLERFGGSIDPVPVANIAAVFEEVHRGHVDFGVVPVENSTDGRVADTLDMFARLRVRICGEVHLRIHHTLLGRCPRGDVTEVYSKPQALSQCRNWLARHLPGARPVEVTSTSTAAQLAQEKAGAAAIASVQAGVHYGLSVLAENIEDNPANVTRFAVIGAHSAARTGHDRTAAMFEVEHRPGGLADAINIFKRARLNLTWIESFPIANSDGRYLFFVELDGHETEARPRKALAALARKALRLEVLGSYPRAAPVE